MQGEQTTWRKTRTVPINLQINDKELSPNKLRKSLIAKRKPFGKDILAIPNQML